MNPHSRPGTRARAADVDEARIRLRAIIAALDEELRESRPTTRDDVVSSIRPDLDVRAALRTIEPELARLSAGRDEMREEAANEQRQARDWQRRVQIAEGEGRADLAMQAGVRQADHQRRADACNDELEEYSALVSEYTGFVEALRKAL